MRSVMLSTFYVLFFLVSAAQPVATPDKIYGELFTDVQRSKIFADSKTFVDATPKKSAVNILAAYRKIRNNPAIKFSLRLFIEENFYLPQPVGAAYESGEKEVKSHIKNLWKVLQRQQDSVVKNSSLLPLPYPYIVPGGRFREIYYWDSYFTMLGLKESKEFAMMENMVKNFAFLINTYGHIPNGNRTYYLSRSQPPYFSLMLELLASVRGDKIYTTYLPQLQKEYEYWMDKSASTKHRVRMPDGSYLNRYYDQLSIPRQESFFEDDSMSQQMNKSQRPAFFRNIRTAAESGWDFSSRWFTDGKNLSTVATTSFVPVDLNCLLYHVEKTLHKAYLLAGKKTSLYAAAAEKRKIAINKYCWSAANNWFVDFNLSTGKQSSSITLAGTMPFFIAIADKNKMHSAEKILREKFLQNGGLVTTMVNTGQQWDAPNGWAPLQWIAIMGLEKYGAQQLAKEVAQRWVDVNLKVFKATGKLMEKYDVVDTTKPGGGGEYPGQDGFGWTNGVLLALMNKYNLQ